VKLRCAAAAAVVLLLAACGDDGTASTASSSTSTTQRTTSLPTTTLPPAFTSSVVTVSAGDLPSSWRPGCPVPVEGLRAIDATHWGFDGDVHEGRIVVAEDAADDIVGVLRDLFDAHYPIERMQPIDVYGGSDDASIDANNTSAFNCRKATGGSGWSEHAYGRAVDLNPLVNPYVKGETVLPPQSAKYLDRTLTDPGVIHDADAAVTAFESRGWVWGGTWTTLKDYQHFSRSGR
jgi:hypothetical protein